MIEITYQGIQMWVDFELILNIMQAKPCWHFLMILQNVRKCCARQFTKSLYSFSIWKRDRDRKVQHGFLFSIPQRAQLNWLQVTFCSVGTFFYCPPVSHLKSQVIEPIPIRPGAINFRPLDQNCAFFIWFYVMRYAICGGLYFPRKFLFIYRPS